MQITGRKHLPLIIIRYGIYFLIVSISSSHFFLFIYIYITPNFLFHKTTKTNEWMHSLKKLIFHLTTVLQNLAMFSKILLCSIFLLSICYLRRRKGGYCKQLWVFNREKERTMKSVPVHTYRLWKKSGESQTLSPREQEQLYWILGVLSQCSTITAKEK